MIAAGGPTAVEALGIHLSRSRRLVMDRTDEDWSAHWIVLVVLWVVVFIGIVLRG